METRDIDSGLIFKICARLDASVEIMIDGV